MNLRRVIAILFSIFALGAFSATAAFAQQYGQYGSQQSTILSVTKTVEDPVSSAFIKNIDPKGNLFVAGNQVTFRVTVTNNGNTSFGFVDVVDTWPNYLHFVSGNGTFNSQNNQFTYRIENLTPGNSDTRDIVGQVVSKSQLPANSVVCAVNYVKVTSNDNQIANDSSQACIRNGTPVNLPSTGPDRNYVIFFVLVAAVAFVGFTLRKARH